MTHPEATGMQEFEPTVGELMRLAQAEKAIDRAEPAQLRELSKMLAKQTLVTYPAAIRWLIRQNHEQPVMAVMVTPETLQAMGLEAPE